MTQKGEYSKPCKRFTNGLYKFNLNLEQLRKEKYAPCRKIKLHFDNFELLK